MSTATVSKPRSRRASGKLPPTKPNTRTPRRSRAEKAAPFSKQWAAERLAELKAIFPQPVIGASDVLEDFRADRF